LAAASTSFADGSAPRVVAAQAVLAVDGGASLDHALPALLARLAPADRGLAQALTYGVLRERRLLDSLLDRLLRDPAQTAPALRALLRVGLQQLRASRVPAHAAVAATVAASA
jgi:NusB family.